MYLQYRRYPSYVSILVKTPSPNPSLSFSLSPGLSLV